MSNECSKKQLTKESMFDIIPNIKTSVRIIYSIREDLIMTLKKMIPVYLLLFSALAFIGLITSKPVTASDGIIRVKSVTSVTITEGDTLWDIAVSYYTSEYSDVNALIKEIKQTNHIDDTIYIGQKIIVPHYIEDTGI